MAIFFRVVIMLQYVYLNIYIILGIYNRDVKMIYLNNNVTIKFQTNLWFFIDVKVDMLQKKIL